MNRRTIGTIVGLVVALIGFIGAVSSFGWSWTGFPDTTLAKWLETLVIPLAIALAVYWLNRKQSQRQEDIQSLQAQDTALQAYLDQISQVLLDKESPLRLSNEGDEARVLARARTLAVLPRLDRARKRSVILFLYEAGLVNKNRLVDLKGADLRGTHLLGANLDKACLSRLDLSKSDLSKAYLFGADLSRSNLFGVNLRNATLREVDLSRSNLSRADLSKSDLSRAKLYRSDLNRANLSNTNLSGADLSRAYLKNATVTQAQLDKCKSLQGATTPDGQKYQDKSAAHRKE